MITRIAHIGHVVADMEKTLQTYGKIFNVDHYYYLLDEDNQIKVGLLYFNDGKGIVEVLEPVGPKPAAAEDFFFDHRDILQKKGAGFSHTLMVVDDMEQTVKELRTRGIEVYEKGLSGMPKLYFIRPEITGGIIMEFCTEEQIKATASTCEKRHIDI